MKKGVVIVNTARGAVMDEAALVKALESGQVASVGLDVYENEPEVHEGLVNNPHVMLVPHLGTYTVEVSDISFGNGVWKHRSIEVKSGKARVTSAVAGRRAFLFAVRGVLLLVFDCPDEKEPRDTQADETLPRIDTAEDGGVELVERAVRPDDRRSKKRGTRAEQVAF